MDIRNGEREAFVFEATLAAPLRRAADRKMDLAATPDISSNRFPKFLYSHFA